MGPEPTTAFATRLPTSEAERLEAVSDKADVTKSALVRRAIFLSRTNHTKVDDEAINNAWKRHFHPEYEETPHHRAVTSHYGRHRFTTYWRVEQDLNRELIKYMRGDTSAGEATDPAGGIDHYIHSHYEDIEPLYREQIYKLGV